MLGYKQNTDTIKIKASTIFKISAAINAEPASTGYGRKNFKINTAIKVGKI